MKTDTVTIRLTKSDTGIFAIACGYGFILDMPCGISMRELLKTGLELDDGYIENNIGTILHDGKPVDDIDEWKIFESSSVAISAALPGLFGAAFRKQGKFAALRPQCASVDNGSQPAGRQITITLKLFNITARELGPKLLRKGVRMSKESFLSLWKTLLKMDDNGSEIVMTLNGEKMETQRLGESITAESVFLKAG